MQELTHKVLRGQDAFVFKYKNDRLLNHKGTADILTPCMMRSALTRTYPVVPNIGQNVHKEIDPKRWKRQTQICGGAFNICKGSIDIHINCEIKS